MCVTPLQSQGALGCGAGLCLHISSKDLSLDLEYGASVSCLWGSVKERWEETWRRAESRLLDETAQVSGVLCVFLYLSQTQSREWAICALDEEPCPEDGGL